MPAPPMMAYNSDEDSPLAFTTHVKLQIEEAGDGKPPDDQKIY